MRTCFCCGHQDTPHTIYPALIEALCELVTKHHVTEFLVGDHGAFDRMAARAVAEIKKTFPHVRLTLLLPYLPAGPLSPCFDGSLYPNGLETVPKRFAIPRANRIAIASSEYMLCYIYRTPSNTIKLLRYAQNRGVIIHNLGKDSR